jgi:hypothetical protein
MSDVLQLPATNQESPPSEILLRMIYDVLANGFALAGSEDVTAHPGGGQANATLMTKKTVNINVCATDDDSVKTLNALTGFQYLIRNTGVATVMIYPAQSEQFDGLSVDEGYELEVDGQITLTCVEQGVWHIN